MKRVCLFLAVLAVASLTGLLPWESHDAASLLPVETLLIDTTGRQVRLTASDGLSGSGRDLAEAMEQMAASAPGELFFGQVSRVIVGAGAARVLPDAAELLRLNTAVYRISGEASELADRIGDLEPYWQAGERRGMRTTLLQYCADGMPAVQLTKEAQG